MPEFFDSGNGYVINERGEYLDRGDGTAMSIPEFEYFANAAAAASDPLAAMAPEAAAAFAENGYWGDAELTPELQAAHDAYDQQQYDQAVADYLQNDPAAADIDPGLFDPFVATAASWEEARDNYHRFGAGVRGELYQPAGASPAEAEPLAEGQHAYGPSGRIAPNASQARFDADGSQTPESRLDSAIEDFVINDTRVVS